MPNPFDRFDTPSAGGNPFDQFDAPPTQRQAEDASMAAWDAVKGTRPLTLDEYVQKSVGLDPNAERLTLLPYPKGALTGQGGKIDWTDWTAPQIVYDMARSFVAPTHVARGGPVTAQDALKFTLDYSVPGSLAGGGPKSRMSRKQFIEDAKSKQQLFKEGSAAFKSPKAVLKDDAIVDMLANVETAISQEGFDPGLHKKAAASLAAVTKKIGEPKTVQEAYIMRRQLSAAAKNYAPDAADERRLGRIILDKVDDWFDNLKPEDAVAGDTKGVGKSLTDARSLWARARKLDTLDRIAEKAANAESDKVGVIKRGLKSILQDPKQLRGFNKDEISAMKGIVRSTNLEGATRLAGKLMYGNRLTALLTAGAGGAATSATGGWGAAVLPALGYGAEKASEAMARRKLGTLNAVVAQGRPLPSRVGNPAATAAAATSRMAPAALAPGLMAVDPENQGLLDFVIRNNGA